MTLQEACNILRGQSEESLFVDDVPTPLYRKAWQKYLKAGGNRTVTDCEELVLMEQAKGNKQWP